MSPRPLLISVTAAIALAAGCSSASTEPPQSGRQIVSAAVAAAKQQSSFHFVESSGSGVTGVQVVGDIGNSSGVQHVTIHDGTKRGHLTLVLSGKTAYFQGDEFGLEGFTGLTPKLAGDFAGKWISIPSTNRSFPSVAGTLAVPTAAVQLVNLPGTLKR